MNILITAGGTSEKIDDVRKISNKATGRLGSLIADNFLNIPNVSVTYVCPKDALTPQNNRVEILFIDSVRSLQITLEQLLCERTFDAVVHSMAVSDYSVKYCLPSQRFANLIAESLEINTSNVINTDELSDQIHSALLTYHDEQNTKKISSKNANLFLCLQKTPKMIALFKSLQPDTVLIGFKLLVNVEESQLFSAARKLIDANKCDFVLANDQQDIDGDRHIGFLIGADQSVLRLNTKSEIAKAITNRVMEKVKERKEK